MNEYRKEDGTEQKEKAAETEVNAPVGGESSRQAECEAQRTSKEAEEVSENQPEEQKSSEELAAEAAAMWLRRVISLRRRRDGQNRSRTQRMRRLRSSRTD